MTITEYAEASGLSERTVRRRIQRGQLRAVLVAGPYGPEYQIVEGDLTSAGDTPQHGQAASPDIEQGDSPAAPDTVDTTATELVCLVRDLNQQVLELAGRVGWLQAENARLTETIRQLQAPAVSHM